MLIRKSKSENIFNKTESDTLCLEVFLVEKEYRGNNSFCANGARVISNYVHTKYPEYNYFYIKTNDNYCQLVKDKDSYGVEVGQTIFNDTEGTFYTLKNSIFLLPYKKKLIPFFYTYSKEPHLITMLLFSKKELSNIGDIINQNYQSIFPYGIHVNQMKIIDKQQLSIITYEKGSRRISKACGTGSISAASFYRKMTSSQNCNEEITVKNLGGNMMVKYNNNNIYLFGKTYLKF